MANYSPKNSGPEIAHSNLRPNLDSRIADWARNAKTIVLNVLDQVTIGSIFSIGARFEW